MDNAQKAIMIGVGLFITIIVIAAVMLITGMGQDLLNSGVDEVNNISSSLKAQLTADYDGNTNLRGSQVIAAVKKYYTNEELTEVSVDGVNYSVNGGAGKIGNLSSTIKVADKYTANLVRDAGTGKTVTGIAFTKN